MVNRMTNRSDNRESEPRIKGAGRAATLAVGALDFKRFIAVAVAGVAVLGLVCLGLAPSAAFAQLMLPGAEPPVTARPSAGASETRMPARPIIVKVPAEDTVLGHGLNYDGYKGEMRFDRSGKDIVLTKLTLPGDRLSAPGTACDVDIVSKPPIVATDIGRPAGAQRWTVAVEACPFTVDLLDGAVLVTSARPSCDFVAADCRVSPIGLWGPQAGTLSAQRIKDLERERVRAETTMRANFRVLLHRAGKDRAAVKAIAGEQAAFSSEREVTCRDYKGEAVHGFCSTQITEARSLALLSKFSEQGGDLMPAKRRVRGGSRPKAIKSPEQTTGE